MIEKIYLTLAIVGFVATSILAEVTCPGVEVLATGGITCDIIKEIVDTHNELRENITKGLVENQPPATNMHEMYWDDELAKNAQDWANHCTPQHNISEDVRFSVGQNIGLSRTNGAPIPVTEFREHIKYWFNEHHLYDFGPIGENLPIGKDPPNTSHYTYTGTIAWANTYLVGCGFSQYKNDSMTYNLYVCNYGPAGNELSRKPYIVGKTRRCPSNFVLSKKFPHLCSPKETPSNSCTSDDEVSTKSSVEKKDTETPNQPKLNDSTSKDKDLLNCDNCDNDRKSQELNNRTYDVILRNILLWAIEGLKKSHSDIIGYSNETNTEIQRSSVFLVVL